MTEIWKDVKGYEGLYQVSNLGRVKSLAKWYGFSYRQEKLIAEIADKNGYSILNLRKDGAKKQVFVHRLVAEAFHDNLMNYPQVNHINGNKRDNRADNLEWCTAKQNIHHAFDLGLSHGKKGSTHPMYGKHHSERTKQMIGEKSRVSWMNRRVVSPH